MPDVIEQTVLPLWPALKTEGEAPTLTLFPHAKAQSLGHVLVLPGGGYANLANHEGPTVARRFNELGFDASVLRYRRGSGGWHHPCEVNDAQRAVRMLRELMRRGELPTHKIAALGFSAGGHLASSLAVFYDRYVSTDDDLVATHSARPDAAVLCYPVIDLIGEHRHEGSARNLLGPQREADMSLRRELSTHLHVHRDVPPTFLWHCMDDASVPVHNSWMFADGCRRHGVPVEMHVYEAGGHGPGLGDGNGSRNVPQITSWPELAATFLKRHLR